MNVETTKEEKTIENQKVVKLGNYHCYGDVINSEVDIEGDFLCKGDVRDSIIRCGGDFTCEGNVTECQVETGTGNLIIAGFEKEENLAYMNKLDYLTNN